MYKRKVKCLGNAVDTNEWYLHPTTLELVLNNKPDKKLCPSELHYVKNKPYTYVIKSEKDNSKLSDRDIQSYMAVPYLNLNMEQMLSIYKIDNIDSMMKWLNDNINGPTTKPIETINRILMVWIRLNFEELKENNRILLSIYKKIGKKYYNNNSNNESLYQEKINNWFKNTDPNSFHLNLTEYIFNV
jgi:hypothetical protein